MLTMVTCSHEFKTRAPWKEKYDKSRQHIKRQSDHFASKVCNVKAMVSTVMYRCESWLINKSEAKELRLSNCGAGENS